MSVGYGRCLASICPPSGWTGCMELGGTMSNNQKACSQLYNIMEFCCKRLGCEKPINKLTVTMIRATGRAKPKMKTKAAEGRRLLPVLREMLANCFSMESSHAQLRFQCVDALCRCYQELEHWEPKASPSRLGQTARQHL
eukprot:9534127-Lingulodinium_polyedra.AAC.1